MNRVVVVPVDLNKKTNRGPGLPVPESIKEEGCVGRWTDEQLEFAFDSRDEISLTIDVLSTFTWWHGLVTRRRLERTLEEADQWKGHFVLMKKNIRRVESLTEGAMYLNLETARCVWHWGVNAKHAFAVKAQRHLSDNKKRIRKQWEDVLIQHTVELHKTNVTSRSIRNWSVNLRLYNNAMLRTLLQSKGLVNILRVTDDSEASMHDFFQRWSSNKADHKLRIALHEKEQLFDENEQLLSQREGALTERDVLIDEREMLLKERDQLVKSLEEKIATSIQTTEITLAKAGWEIVFLRGVLIRTLRFHYHDYLCSLLLRWWLQTNKSVLIKVGDALERSQTSTVKLLEEHKKALAEMRPAENVVSLESEKLMRVAKRMALVAMYGLIASYLIQERVRLAFHFWLTVKNTDKVVPLFEQLIEARNKAERGLTNELGEDVMNRREVIVAFRDYETTKDALYKSEEHLGIMNGKIQWAQHTAQIQSDSLRVRLMETQEYVNNNDTYSFFPSNSNRNINSNRNGSRSNHPQRNRGDTSTRHLEIGQEEWRGEVLYHKLA